MTKDAKWQSRLHVISVFLRRAAYHFIPVYSSEVVIAGNRKTLYGTPSAKSSTGLVPKSLPVWETTTSRDIKSNRIRTIRFLSKISDSMALHYDYLGARSSGTGSARCFLGPWCWRCGVQVDDIDLKSMFPSQWHFHRPLIRSHEPIGIWFPRWDIAVLLHEHLKLFTWLASGDHFDFQGSIMTCCEAVILETFTFISEILKTGGFRLIFN